MGQIALSFHNKGNIIVIMVKNVVIGVSSGIAAYKSLELVRLLVQEGLNCFVVMTKYATKMVTPREFEKVSGNKVHVELFTKDFNYKNILKSKKVEHIELADKANVFVVVPATANIIAKIACGFADDFLTTTLLAVTCPVIICPSMNTNMWNNPAVVENIGKLALRGYQIIEPASGMLACGYFGIGRLEEIEKIKNEILRTLSFSGSLSGRKILITAGSTQDKIDDVRFIANKSSGKMGVAVARECSLRGAKVLFVRAKSAVLPDFSVEQQEFESADDLEGLIFREIKNYDVVVHTAAVGDFSVNDTFSGKIPSDREFQVKLKPRAKIVDSFKKINPKVKVVAFKAEFEKSEADLVKCARGLISRSKADVVVANDIAQKDRGLEVDNNEVVVVMGDKSPKKIPFASKQEVARQLVDYLVQQKVL